MAKAEPHVNLIAIEVYRPGLAQLLQQVEREEIPNVRVLRGDAMDVLENMVAPESLTASGCSSRIRGPRPAITSVASCRGRRSR